MLTSPTQNKKHKASSKGFTLLEVMIALAIIVGIVGLAITNLQPPSRGVRADIRNLLVLSKRLNQQAQLDQKMYRLAFEINEEDAGRYWVESADRKVAVNIEKEREKSSFEDQEDEAEQSPSDFKVDSSVLKERVQLPEGFKFIKLMLLEQNLLFENGTGYIHFFPQGLADSAALQIANEDRTLSWTLVTNPLTGNVDLIDGLYDQSQLRRD